jgi:hypothetical protein
MELHDLVRALLQRDALTARQWVADAARESIVWTEIPRPVDWTPLELAVAAGVVELLASRADQPPPSWTAAVDEAPTPVYLSRAAETMPRLRHMCEAEGPESLRRRQIYAPPEFLTIA